MNLRGRKVINRIGKQQNKIMFSVYFLIFCFCSSLVFAHDYWIGLRLQAPANIIHCRILLKQFGSLVEHIDFDL